MFLYNVFMADVKTLPDKVAHPEQSVSKIKLGILAIIVIITLIFSFASQGRPKEVATARDVAAVLGEETNALGDLLPEGGIMDASASGKIAIPNNTKDMVKLGEAMVASAAGNVLGAFNKKADEVASSSANGVSGFIYKNTIERVINALIHTLPDDRQKQYGK